MSNKNVKDSRNNDSLNNNCSVQDQVKTSSENIINNSKGRVQEHLEAHASDMRSAHNNISENSPLAFVLSGIAEQIEKASSALENKNASEIVSDIKTYVKKNPEIAYLSCAVAGFGLSRLFSAQPSEGHNDNNRMSNLTRPQQPAPMKADAYESPLAETNGTHNGLQ